MTINHVNHVLCEPVELLLLLLTENGLHLHLHLADAFIQSDLHCIQVTVFTFLSTLAFPGNRTHDLGVASAMLYQLSYRKASRKVYLEFNVLTNKTRNAHM